MLQIILISILILVIVFFIVKKILSKKSSETSEIIATKEESKPTNLKDEKPIVKEQKSIKETTHTPLKSEKPTQKPTPKPIVKELPKCNYPNFTHSRLLEMGLSDEEAKEFVLELIPQIKKQIVQIKEAFIKQDFHQMERLTHSIKGSATNLGKGGVSDLLVECNTYLKTGKDIDIVKTYFKYLVYYTKELEKQYK